jgi:hypothetical protein
MALDFPSGPTTGQTFIAAGVIWTWDGAKWVATGIPAFTDPAQGRLTISSGVPVMTASVAAATTVYFAPYNGRYCPIFDGTNWTMKDFTSSAGDTVGLSQLLTDTTKSPAAAIASSVYDMFVWNDAGTLRCTRGPAWTSVTIRSAGTALATQNGVPVNNVAITNGPGAKLGTWVGTIATNAAAKVDFVFGSAAAGGGAASFGVWNYYNRQPVATMVNDSTSNWTYAVNAVRAANGSNNNRVTYVCGLADDPVDADYSILWSSNLAATILTYVGIGVDSTTAFSGRQTGIGSVLTSGNSLFASTSGLYVGYPGIGQHFLQALEISPQAQTATFYGQGGGAANTSGLVARLRM